MFYKLLRMVTKHGRPMIHCLRWQDPKIQQWKHYNAPLMKTAK